MSLQMYPLRWMIMTVYLGRRVRDGYSERVSLRQHSVPSVGGAMAAVV